MAEMAARRSDFSGRPRKALIPTDASRTAPAALAFAVQKAEPRTSPGPGLLSCHRRYGSAGPGPRYHAGAGDGEPGQDHAVVRQVAVRRVGDEQIELLAPAQQEVLGGHGEPRRAAGLVLVRIAQRDAPDVTAPGAQDDALGRLRILRRRPALPQPPHECRVPRAGGILPEAVVRADARPAPRPAAGCPLVDAGGPLPVGVADGDLAGRGDRQAASGFRAGLGRVHREELPAGLPELDLAVRAEARVVVLVLP